MLKNRENKSEQERKDGNESKCRQKQREIGEDEQIQRENRNYTEKKSKIQGNMARYGEKEHNTKLKPEIQCRKRNRKRIVSVQNYARIYLGQKI